MKSIFMILILLLISGCSKDYDLTDAKIGQTQKQIISEYGKAKEAWTFTFLGQTINNYWYGNNVIATQYGKVSEIRINLSDDEIKEIRGWYKVLGAKRL